MLESPPPKEAFSQRAKQHALDVVGTLPTYANLGKSAAVVLYHMVLNGRVGTRVTPT